ncbi:MAG TPA: tetratricopeptide repeat protein [Bryobacteraceae bacterium]|nr:tetratricopeptide repeat protein [Bryobacteraceae bacterium]
MTRHELKEQLQHDHFTDTVSGVVDYATSHRQELIRWVPIIVGILVIAGGAFWYAQYRNSAREQDLNNAFAIADRPVGPAAPGVSTFATEDAKSQAVMKAFSDVVAKDGGSRQGLIAQYYLGTLKAKKGDVKGAEADLSRVADSGVKVAPLAKIALAGLYAADNKTPQAQSLLQSLVNKPTDLVSKSQAQILLARLEEDTNPQQAKKLLQQVRTEAKDPAVDRAVEQISSQMNK